MTPAARIAAVIEILESVDGTTRPGDEMVMQAGMTLHLMPAVWLDAQSMVMTEPFVVTETGAECLCDFPRRLEIRR